MSTQKIEDGGPAYPHCFEDISGHPSWRQSQGMSLRDWFATSVDKDEYGDLLYRNASRLAMEALAGPAPVEPGDRATDNERVTYQLAKIDWELRFRAAIRYRMADAMLRAKAEGQQ